MQIYQILAHKHGVKKFGFGPVRFYLFKHSLNQSTGELKPLSSRLNFGALIFKPGSFRHRPWGSEVSQTFSVRRTVFGFSSSPLRGVSENWILNQTRIINFIFQTSPMFGFSKPVEALVFANRLMVYSNTWFGGIASVLGTYYSFQPNWAIGFVETPCNQPSLAVAKPNQPNV